MVTIASVDFGKGNIEKDFRSPFGRSSSVTVNIPKPVFYSAAERFPPLFARFPPFAPAKSICLAGLGSASRFASASPAPGAKGAGPFFWALISELVAM